MTKAEKMIEKDVELKKTVVEILELFNNKSYKFATDALKTAKYYVEGESKFDVYSAVEKIETLSEKVKQVKKK